MKVTEPDRNGMLRVDKHMYGFQIIERQELSDDYVNLVRSVLPDRLSIPITQEDQLAWELEDQLKGLKRNWTRVLSLKRNMDKKRGSCWKNLRRRKQTDLLLHNTMATVRKLISGSDDLPIRWGVLL